MNWTLASHFVSRLQSAVAEENYSIYKNALNDSITLMPNRYNAYTTHDGIITHLRLPELYGNRVDYVPAISFLHIVIILLVFSFLINFIFIFRCTSRSRYFSIGTSGD